MRALLLSILLALNLQSPPKTEISLHVSPQVCFPVCNVTASYQIKPTEYDRAYEISIDNGSDFTSFETLPISSQTTQKQWKLRSPGTYEVLIKVYDSQMKVSASKSAVAKVVGEP